MGKIFNVPFYEESTFIVGFDNNLTFDLLKVKPYFTDKMLVTFNVDTSFEFITNIK